MNSLSWMIYLADVAGSVDFSIGFIAVLSFIGTAIAIGARAIGSSDPKDDDLAACYRAGGTCLKYVGPLFVVSFLANVFIPNKDTIYAIAASETGEEVLKTPEASKARQALNAWLDKQIGGQKQVEK